MNLRIKLVLTSMALIAGTVAAQTVTGSGTSNTVPVFTGSSTIGNSPISISGSNVGIGTTSPQDVLDVNGGSVFRGYQNIYYQGTTFSGFFGSGASIFTSGTNGQTDMALRANGNVGISSAYATTPQLVLNTAGNFGIGTVNPFTRLDVNGAATTAGPYNNTPVPILNQSTSFSALFTDTGHSSGLMIGTLPYNAVWLQAVQPDGSNDAPSHFKWISLQPAGGAVGIGTTTPGSELEVNGNVALTSGSGASITYADGTKQTTAWTGVLCGGDYAEAMNAVGGKAKYEPGDVLVLAPEDNSDVEKSAEPYSTMVAGIFATKPGVIGRRDALAKSTEDIPMAMVGVVPTKVSAENGPIHKGDLLVTSSTPGFAMKGTDRSRMLGAVIGKAMGSLDSGAGAIEVLVTLQ